MPLFSQSVIVDKLTLVSAEKHFEGNDANVENFNPNPGNLIFLMSENRNVATTGTQKSHTKKHCPNLIEKKRLHVVFCEIVAKRQAPRHCQFRPVLIKLSGTQIISNFRSSVKMLLMR